MQYVFKAEARELCLKPHVEVDIWKNWAGEGLPRNWLTTYESRGTIDPWSAQLPAVVSILSFDAILSFKRNGMPCRGPMTLPAWRKSSS